MVIQAWLILIKKPFESHDASKRFLPFVQDTFASKIIRNSDYFSDFWNFWFFLEQTDLPPFPINAARIVADNFIALENLNQ